MPSAKRATRSSAPPRRKTVCRSLPPIPATPPSCWTGTSKAKSQFEERAALDIIRGVRHRNKKVPIFLIADRTLVSELPLEVVKQVHEYIHLFGDTPAFIASRARLRHRALPRAASAALLPRTPQIQRPVRLLLGRARPHGRRRLPQAPGRPGVPPLLRRKPAALRPRHLHPRRSAPGSITSALPANPSATPPASSAPTGPSTCSAAPAPPTRSSATASSRRTTSFWPTPTATNPSATRSPSPARAPSTSSPRATATA